MSKRVPGGKASGEKALEAIARTAGFIVQQTYMAGGDVALAAKGLVGGAVQGAVELGLDATEAATVVAQSAFEAAGEISAEAGEQVRAILAWPVAGVKIVLTEPFKPVKKG